MNTLVIVVIAACCLAAGYLLYGRWLAHKWGIDPNAKTPAVTKEDGQDYVPTDGWVVFAHQFSSIAGAGPVTGAIQAAVFGWVPVFLWIILGGIFFGAVTDFGALYASVKNEGKSMGLLIEQYIGKTGKKLFLLFCWLFTLIVTAAFADMVAGTFNAYETVDGVTIAKEIELEDAFENMGAQLVKEVSVKTNDVAGDGTTTAALLAQTIIREGMKNIAAGANPMVLKKGIAKATEYTVEELKKISKPIESKTAIAQVASVSAGDEEIGTLLSDAFEKVGKDGVITIDESKTMKTELSVVEGMQFDRGYASPYMMTNPDKMEDFC